MKDNKEYIVDQIKEIVNDIYLQLELYIEIERQRGNKLNIEEKCQSYNSNSRIMIISVTNTEEEVVAVGADVVKIGEEDSIKPVLILDILFALGLTNVEDKYNIFYELTSLFDELK